MEPPPHHRARTNRPSAYCCPRRSPTNGCYCRPCGRGVGTARARVVRARGVAAARRRATPGCSWSGRSWTCAYRWSRNRCACCPSGCTCCRATQTCCYGLSASGPPTYWCAPDEDEREFDHPAAHRPATARGRTAHGGGAARRPRCCERAPTEERAPVG